MGRKEKYLIIIILLFTFLGILFYKEKNKIKYNYIYSGISIKDCHNNIIIEEKEEEEIQIPIYEEPIYDYYIEEEQNFITYENPEPIVYNEYTIQVFQLVNNIRRENGLNELILDNTLIEIATIRAEEASINWSHTRPDGTKWITLVDSYGLYGTFGENLAYGQESPQEVVEDWMASEGHRDNILFENFTHIGIGIYEIDGVIYWAQTFSN